MTSLHHSPARIAGLIFAPSTVSRCLDSAWSRKTRPLATRRASVTRRSGEPNLPVRDLLLLLLPSGEGGGVGRLKKGRPEGERERGGRVVKREMMTEGEEACKTISFLFLSQTTHLEIPAPSIIPLREAPAAIPPIGRRDRAKWAEAGPERLRAERSDEDKSELNVDARRSGSGIPLPLRTSALARKLLPGPGGGGMAASCFLWSSPGGPERDRK